MDRHDTHYLSSYWWVLTIRGIAAILFGLAAVFWPGLTLVTLIYLFSAFILVNGIVDIIYGLVHAGRQGINWILTLLLGFLEVGVGVFLLRNLDVAFTTFVLLIGFILVVRGIFEVVAAFTEIKRGTATRILVIIAGVISALAGIVILRQPAAGGVAFVWIFGVYALILGPVLIAMSIEAKQIQENQESTEVPVRARGRRAS